MQGFSAVTRFFKERKQEISYQREQLKRAIPIDKSAEVDRQRSGSHDFTLASASEVIKSSQFKMIVVGHETAGG
jgi:hypothetical protein